MGTLCEANELLEKGHQTPFSDVGRYMCIFKSALHALKRAHELAILHTDICAENILIDEVNNQAVLIGWTPIITLDSVHSSNLAGYKDEDADGDRWRDEEVCRLVGAFLPGPHVREVREVRRLCGELGVSCSLLRALDREDEKAGRWGLRRKEEGGRRGGDRMGTRRNRKDEDDVDEEVGEDVEVGEDDEDDEDGEYDDSEEH